MRKDEFEFNGHNSRDLGVIMGNVMLPLAPTMADQSVDIPAKYGNYYLGTDYTSREISIPITILAHHDQDKYNRILRNLTNAMITDRPDRNATEYDLCFGFDPDVHYRGHFSSIPTPTLIQNGVWDAQTTLVFTMSDPRGFMAPERIPLRLGQNNVNIKGTARADPIIQMEAKDTLHYAGAIINGEDLAAGPEDADEQNQAQTKWIQVVNDDMSSMATWTTESTAISPMTTASTRKIQGSLVADPSHTSIHPGWTAPNSKGKRHWDFGPYAGQIWQGPAARYRGLEKSLSDFQFNVRLHHHTFSGLHNGRAMGDIEFMGLDPNGKSFIRCAIKSQPGGHYPYVLLQVGNPGTHFEKPDDHVTIYNGKGPSKAFVNKTDKHFKILLSPAVKQKIPGKTKKVKIRKARKGHKAKYKTVRTKPKTIIKKKARYAKVVNAFETSALSDAWIDFHVERQNGEWAFSIVQMNLKTQQHETDGTRHLVLTKSSKQFKVPAAKCKSRGYNALLGGFGIFMLRHGISEDDGKIDYRKVYLAITNLTVYGRNDLPYEVTHPTEIAHKGQELIFNCETDQIRCGTQQIRPTFSTSFPKLNPGMNSIYVVAENDQAVPYLLYTPRTL